MVDLPLHWLLANEPTRWLSISHKLLLVCGHRGAHLWRLMDGEHKKVNLSCSLSQWYLEMGFHPCHNDLEHSYQIHIPVELKGAKHSGRLSKFFSPHWNAGVVSQAVHHMVAHEEESGNLLNTWLRSDGGVWKDIFKRISFSPFSLLVVQNEKETIPECTTNKSRV